MCFLVYISSHLCKAVLVCLYKYVLWMYLCVLVFVCACVFAFVCVCLCVCGFPEITQLVRKRASLLGGCEI